MMRFRRHIVSLVSLALALALGQASGPAFAAGGSFTVGTCSKNALPDLPSAITAVNALPSAAHKSITVCPGTYQVAGSLMVQTSHVMFKGKKGAVITTPDNYTGSVFNASGVDQVTIQNLTIRPGGGYNGNLVFFANVRDAVAQKLVIDGGDAVASGVALTFQNSSGKMAANQVLNWREAVSTGAASPVVAQGGGVETVRVTGNTISDFENDAVQAFNLASFTATGNHITGTTVQVQGIAVGGITVFSVRGGRISGNQVTGGAFPAHNSSVGIDLAVANHLKVSGNKLAHWDFGIVLSSGCAPAAASFNRITGNKISETTFGILVDPNESGDLCVMSADSNVITGNKIVDTAAFGNTGIGFSMENGATALNELVRGNTISGFGIGLTSPLPDPVHHVEGVFTPNKVQVPPA